MVLIKSILVSFLLLLMEVLNADNRLLTPYELGNQNQTAEYHQIIDFYQKLSVRFKDLSIESVGMTDIGLPLHKVTLKSESVDPQKIITILINNGIHPGEPDGIDATMMLFRDIADGTINVPENTVLVTIPVYNVGGALNRNSHTRVNQNGPASYGFRGNARNYDLNRDFIKADTLNARSFIQIFHGVDPDVFIDTHVSNGADYQYTLTHLFTQHNKLGGELGSFLKYSFQPALEKRLSENGWPITPYVNVFNRPPDTGFSQFFDSPRYSTGYTALFNTLGMMLETHMLKSYEQRVQGTYTFLKMVIAQAHQDAEQIIKFRRQAFTHFKIGQDYPLQWQLINNDFSMIDFLGYKSKLIKSEVTGLMRLKYDRNEPFKKQVRYQDNFEPTVSVTIPQAYVIAQGWHDVIDLLKLNQIKMKRLEQDKVLTVQSYQIKNYSTQENVYEGHFIHDAVQLDKSVKKIRFRAGDYYIPTQQKGLRYLLETLEPEAMDSFFRWNFFDTILTQKEGFSAYVWEDKARQILAENPDLKMQFEAKKKSDADFSTNAYMQLKWLHHHSEYLEAPYRQYPVYRIP